MEAVYTDSPLDIHFTYFLVFLSCKNIGSNWFSTSEWGRERVGCRAVKLNYMNVIQGFRVFEALEQPRINAGCSDQWGEPSRARRWWWNVFRSSEKEKQRFRGSEIWVLTPWWTKCCQCPPSLPLSFVFLNCRTIALQYCVGFCCTIMWRLLLLPSRFSCVRLCATPQTAAHQAPLSLGFSRQECWSGLPFPSPMHESEKWKWSNTG